VGRSAQEHNNRVLLEAEHNNRVLLEAEHNNRVLLEAGHNNRLLLEAEHKNRLLLEAEHNNRLLLEAEHNNRLRLDEDLRRSVGRSSRLHSGKHHPLAATRTKTIDRHASFSQKGNASMVIIAGFRTLLVVVVAVVGLVVQTDTKI
jgi:hypothetical protein